VVPTVPKLRSTSKHNQHTSGDRQRKGKSEEKCSIPKEWRMSGVEWAILFLQLMVAIMQLLDAYLKFGA